MSAIIDPILSATAQSKVTANDLLDVIDAHVGQIQVLSLDCFDTLLWRHTATPRDIFCLMEDKPIFRSLGVTAAQRMSAAARAYRSQYITKGHHQIHISDIYARFTALSPSQQLALAEEEIQTEIEWSYVFPPVVALIRRAAQIGLKVIIVSDIYYSAEELRRILAAHLPADVLQSISMIFTSIDHQQAKSDGLFAVVQKKLNIPAQQILHIGDHATADYTAPKQCGMKAIHFLQFQESIHSFLNLQHAVSGLATLALPENENKNRARLNPFRGVFSLLQSAEQTPERVIGYQSFGPIMYGFAQFVLNELATLRAAGKKPKVFFLLRDAYLLAKACAAYAGEEVGKLVRIRKFVTVAASFRSQADIDHYLSSIKPVHFNYWVIAEQLLLPVELTQKIIQYVHLTSQPEKAFYETLHKPEVVALIIERSSAYRDRLRKYLQREMQVQPGETMVLVDTGYAGVTQEFLTRTFKDEMQIDITGIYLIASHEPDRPDCRAFFTSSWCEHGLLEQSCTYQEGAVVDYDEQGQPIFDELKLSAQQYAKVQALQEQVLAFIKDAKAYFSEVSVPLVALKNAAFAALHRQIYFPTGPEVAYFQSYQHDKDRGEDGKKTMFDLAKAQFNLQQKLHLTSLHPYEARTTNLNLALSSQLQRAYDLDLADQPISLHAEIIKIVMIQGKEVKQCEVRAIPSWDGYYSFYTPLTQNTQIGIMFGANYEFLQIDTVTLVGATTNASFDRHLILDQMVAKRADLYECNPSGLMILTPLPEQQEPYRYQIIFRPIVRRAIS